MREGSQGGALYNINHNQPFQADNLLPGNVHALCNYWMAVRLIKPRSHCKQAYLAGCCPHCYGTSHAVPHQYSGGRLCPKQLPPERYGILQNRCSFSIEKPRGTISFDGCCLLGMGRKLHTCVSISADSCASSAVVVSPCPRKSTATTRQLHRQHCLLVKFMQITAVSATPTPLRHRAVPLSHSRCQWRPSETSVATSMETE